jgi:hypothetical protein
MNPSDAEMKKLKDENVRLNREMVAIKEFFGYNANDGVSQMEEHKSKCEAKDNAERMRDAKYDESCKRADHLSDLGVKLGECAYEVSILNNKLRKCCGPTGPALRKEFVRSFNGFKATADKEHIEEFFSIIIEWLELQRDIWRLEDQIERA